MINIKGKCYNAYAGSLRYVYKNGRGSSTSNSPKMTYFFTFIKKHIKILKYVSIFMLKKQKSQILLYCFFSYLKRLRGILKKKENIFFRKTKKVLDVF